MIFYVLQSFCATMKSGRFFVVLVMYFQVEHLEVFRFIDAKGKGKVKKTDFVAAVEKMRISLSREDINKVFAKIDSNKVGYFTF